MMFEMPLGFEIEYKGVAISHLEFMAVLDGMSYQTLAKKRLVTVETESSVRLHYVVVV